MDHKEILRKFKKRELDFEMALNALADIGWCPALLFDDNGHWAVVFDGVASVSTKKAAWTGSYFVDKFRWKKTIRQALICSLEND